MCAQMLGKLRVALSPPQPNWMFTPLHLNARGFTTGSMPWRRSSIEALIDVFSSEIILRRSTGDEVRIALVPSRTIAEIFAALHEALATLGVTQRISNLPQEVPDTIPFDEDTRASAYDPQAVRRWFQTTTMTANVFDTWHSHFFGRSAIRLWWGAFDLALTLFNGRHAAPPTDRGYLLKYDLDAELMNCGLYLGDEKTSPFFYGYIYPQPPGAEKLALAPDVVKWSDTLREWVLPYDAVRFASKPEEELRAFLDALYGHCVTSAGWNQAQLSYQAPRR